MITDNMQLKEIFKTIKDAGYTGGQTIFNKYCSNLRKELKSNLPRPKVNKRFINKQDLIKYIWSGKEINENDRMAVFSRYSELSVIEECVKNFRNVFDQKTVIALSNFIEKYSTCSISNLKLFANGLKRDISAVEYAVVTQYSNGVTKGNNHRLKLIKRLMYGRAKLPLLRAKVIPNSIFYIQ